MRAVRRSFLLGRPFRSIWAVGSGFSSGGVRSRYNACASGAGPRRVPIAAIWITRMRRACAKVSVSPAVTVTDALEIRDPFRRTWPPVTCLVASERVLKNRACHNHLSTRPLSGASATDQPLSFSPISAAAKGLSGSIFFSFLGGRA